MLSRWKSNRWEYSRKIFGPLPILHITFNLDDTSVNRMSMSKLMIFYQFKTERVNPFTIMAKISWAGVYGKCVLQQNQTIFIRGLLHKTLNRRKLRLFFTQVFSCVKVNGRIVLTWVFSFNQSFLRLRVLCNRPQVNMTSLNFSSTAPDIAHHTRVRQSMGLGQKTQQYPCNRGMRLSIT